MIQVFHHSEAGGHAKNEDCLELAPLPNVQNGFLCVIADGQGGNSGGHLAAATACRATIGAALGLPASELSRPATWLEIAQLANRAVADEPKAGFTTLVAFAISPNWIYGVSNGDSVAALLPSGKSFVDLTENQHKNPPVGSGECVFMPFASELAGPWSVLAMTDGVWKYAGWERVLRCTVDHSGEEICKTLRKAASLLRTGELQDDFTLVVLQQTDK